MTQAPRFTRTLVVGFTIAITSLLPAAASASEDGWAHRSTQTTSQDGWSVRTQPAVPVDGWAARAPEATTPIKDGFQVSLVELPQTQIARDGWEVASVELPRPEVVRDGWQVASVELPAGAAASDAPAPSRPALTTADLMGMALAASITAALAAMSIMFYRHHHHPV